MCFVFEKVGDKKELWSEIGFRDLESGQIPYSKNHLWCADKMNSIFNVKVNINCEPECIGTDYNGR